MAYIYALSEEEVREWAKADEEEKVIGRVWVAGEGKSRIQEVRLSLFLTLFHLASFTLGLCWREQSGK